MGKKSKSGGGGKKIGHQKSKRAQMNYTGEMRWDRNRQRKMRKHFVESGEKDGQCFGLLQSKFGTKGIAGFTDPRPAAEEAKQKFQQIRGAAELKRKPKSQPKVQTQV